MSSLGTLEKMVAKTVVSGGLLSACNKNSVYGEYGDKTQAVFK